MMSSFKWKYLDKIEKMSIEELSERIKKVMDLELTNKIVSIPYEGKIKQIISYSYKELTAKCPVTGYKDLYKLSIKFIPDKCLPELKSLKFYYMNYEEIPISHEHLLAKIFKDFKDKINPQWIEIALDVAIRGGIKTTIIYKEEKNE